MSVSGTQQRITQAARSWEGVTVQPQLAKTKIQDLGVSGY